LEYDSKHAEVARANLARAGLNDLVDVRVGAALDAVPGLAADLDDGRTEPFDLVFIDADKASIPDYVTWSVRLTRPGGVIIVDNVVRGGAVLEANSEDPNVQGMRRFIDVMAADPGVSATVIQTVGAKGHDGFAIAIVGRPQLAAP